MISSKVTKTCNLDRFTLICYFYRYSLDEFGTARRTAIVRGFIDALTRGGKCELIHGLSI